MKTVFNEYGEPIGTERDPDPDEQQDMYDAQHEQDPDPEIYDGIDDCYFCGKTYNCDAMIYPEITVNGIITAVPVCGNCEHEIK